MEKAKIQLSADELLLMQNSAWILTKNDVMEKLGEGLGELSEQMRQALSQAHLPDPALLQSNPKISRGEKYLGLPYLMLDYPRVFEKENILAIRTFFWWGNFCSVTLHVKGKYQARIIENCMQRLRDLQDKSWYAAVSANEWNHDLASPAYQPLSGFSQQDLERMPGRDFIKLSSLVNLGAWSEMEKKIFEAFLLCVGMIES